MEGGLELTRGLPYGYHGLSTNSRAMQRQRDRADSGREMRNRDRGRFRFYIQRLYSSATICTSHSVGTGGEEDAKRGEVAPTDGWMGKDGRRRTGMGWVYVWRWGDGGGGVQVEWTRPRHRERKGDDSRGRVRVGR